MKIRNIIIRRAKTIRNILVNNTHDKKYFDRMLQIYECRLLGFVFYRTTASFDSEKVKILNGEDLKRDEKSVCKCRFSGFNINTNKWECTKCGKVTN